MAKHRLQRSGDSALKFEGEVIAEASLGVPSGPTMTLYRVTQSSRPVLHTRTPMPAGQLECQAEVFRDEADVATWLRQAIVEGNESTAPRDRAIGQVAAELLANFEPADRDLDAESDVEANIKANFVPGICAVLALGPGLMFVWLLTQQPVFQFWVAKRPGDAPLSPSTDRFLREAWTLLASAATSVTDFLTSNPIDLREAQVLLLCVFVFAAVLFVVPNWFRDFLTTDDAARRRDQAEALGLAVAALAMVTLLLSGRALGLLGHVDVLAYGIPIGLLTAAIARASRHFGSGVLDAVFGTDFTRWLREWFRSPPTPHR